MARYVDYKLNRAGGFVLVGQGVVFPGGRTEGRKQFSAYGILRPAFGMPLYSHGKAVALDGLDDTIFSQGGNL